MAGFLRMAPDVAIVGEVRDREALPLLLTLSSGVKGYTTIHAGSARQALTRLRFICQLAETANELPMTALNTLVSESVDLVVHCARTPQGPQVTEVVAVEDLNGADATQFTVTELFGRAGPDRPSPGPARFPPGPPASSAGRTRHPGAAGRLGGRGQPEACGMSALLARPAGRRRLTCWSPRCSADAGICCAAALPAR